MAAASAFAARLRRYFPAAIILAAVTSSFITYLTVANVLPFGGSYRNLLGLLLVNLGLLFLLGYLVGRRLRRAWRVRRRGGGRLHARMVGRFAFVTVAPALVVGVTALVFFNLIINVWFSNLVNRALDSSGVVAEAYIEEHRKRIQTDAERLRLAFNAESELIYLQPELLQRALVINSRLLGLNRAMIFEKNGRVLARLVETASLIRRPPPRGFSAADRGDTFVFTASGAGLVGGDQVLALSKLERLRDTYLYIGRPVDPLVLSYIENARLSRDQYGRARAARFQLQLVFTAIFAVTALLLLLAAIWLGLLTADSIAKPIELLIAATARMNLAGKRVQVSPFDRDDELQTLRKAFNAMSGRITDQRRKLQKSNKFMQSVLKGVSAGVIGLGPKGEIRTHNLSAGKLCGAERGGLVGKSLSAVSGQLGRLWQEFVAAGIEQSEQEVEMNRRGSAPGTLFVRFTASKQGGRTIGYVVTLDDLSGLIAAKRRAAWSDVARRIAHEIKNPLTPIKLCAEWLKQTVGKKSDEAAARRRLNTIIHQVDSIRRMTDEFAAFARLPTPRTEAVSPASLCRDVVFLQSQEAKDIKFVTDFKNLRSKGGKERKFLLDPVLINQLLINLLKNACEAIRAGEKPVGKGLVKLEAKYKNLLEIKVTDNGIGLGDKSGEELVEPYVTTRAAGTGLGLAVVAKIAADHGGAFTISAGPEGGAVATVVLPALLPIRPADKATKRRKNADKISDG